MNPARTPGETPSEASQPDEPLSTGRVRFQLEERKPDHKGDDYTTDEMDRASAGSKKTHEQKAIGTSRSRLQGQCTRKHKHVRAKEGQEKEKKDISSDDDDTSSVRLSSSEDEEYDSSDSSDSSDSEDPSDAQDARALWNRKSRKSIRAKVRIEQRRPGKGQSQADTNKISSSSPSEDLKYLLKLRDVLASTFPDAEPRRSSSAGRDGMGENAVEDVEDLSINQNNLAAQPELAAALANADPTTVKPMSGKMLPGRTKEDHQQKKKKKKDRKTKSKSRHSVEKVKRAKTLEYKRVDQCTLILDLTS